MLEQEFLNALKILRSIDRDHLEQVGVRLSDADWIRFRDHPSNFLICAQDQIAEGIWVIIERRMNR